MLFSGYARNRGRFSPFTSFRGNFQGRYNSQYPRGLRRGGFEDEDIMVPFKALDYLDESISKGSSLKRCSYSLSLQNNNNKKIKTASSVLTALSPKKQVNERLCCIFPGSMMEIKPVIDKIFQEEIATLLESSKMKKTFSNINI